MKPRSNWWAVPTFLFLTTAAAANGKPSRLTLSWADDYLTIHGDHLPADAVRVHYLEAYCRDGSTDRAWEETVIGHRTELLTNADEGRRLQLRDTLQDGVVVTHKITTRRVDDQTDAVDFHLVANNPTQTASRAHWAQPCIRVADFTGGTEESYVSKCFVYIDGRLTRMPTQPWATSARYVPGQVYAAPGVNRNDVNPRPLSTLLPSNGLIGCFSADEKQILATTWEPYQELFQGVGVCIHSDFRLGGLAPGETKKIRGTIFTTNAGPDDVLKLYNREFPEHSRRSP